MNDRPFLNDGISNSRHAFCRIPKVRFVVLGWAGLLAFGAVGCSEKKESGTSGDTATAPTPAPAVAPASPSPVTPVASATDAPASVVGYVPLNSDAEDGLWTNLRAVQETTPSGGLTFRVQAVEGSGARAALGKDLADKLKKAGFESVFETIKPDDAKPGISAMVKCHFTRTPITEKVFSAIGRFYIEGQFEMRSDDDLPKQEVVLILYGNPSFSESGRVSFK